MKKIAKCKLDKDSPYGDFFTSWDKTIKNIKFFNSNETQMSNNKITEEKYLESKQIVKRYESQLHAENGSEAFYANEFNKVIDLDIFKIKIYGCTFSDTWDETLSTKHINLNENSVSILRQFLNLKFPIKN